MHSNKWSHEKSGSLYTTSFPWEHVSTICFSLQFLVCHSWKKLCKNWRHVKWIYSTFEVNWHASGKSNEALQSKIKNRKGFQGYSSIFSEVICNQFMEDTYLPCVVRTVFGFARWSTRYSLRSVLVFTKPKRCCTSVVSAVLLILVLRRKRG